MNGATSLDSRVERLESAMQALTERLDGDRTENSNYEPENSEPVGFQGTSYLLYCTYSKSIC